MTSRFSQIAVAITLSLAGVSLASASAADGDDAAAGFAPVEPIVEERSENEIGLEGQGPVNWKGLMHQTALALAFQHAFRVAAQPKTRAELGGPFFKDYIHSLRGIKGWDDGDSDFVNYVAHPIMGATAGFMYLDNDRRGDVSLGLSRRYWASRLRATGFAAAYTVAFEVAPISEASIGNVGLNPGTNGTVDFVMTPVGGLGMMVAEDALDKHVLRPLERNSSNRWLVATLRCVLNPARSTVQITRFKPPWRRAGRPLPH